MPCSRRALKYRRIQIREGWHRTDEPLPGPAPATPEQRALVVLRAHFEFERAAAQHAALWAHVADLDQAIAEVEEAITAQGLRGRIAPPHQAVNDAAQADEDQADNTGGDGDGDGSRRVRSTRRRQDAPDLPRRKVLPGTVGRTYTSPDGRVYQPSMWLTLTLDSYGPVHTQTRGGRGCACGRRHAAGDGLLGTPLDPDSYDYRRAAWDAVHFPRLLDRFWQNLRRVAGWNVQYAGCVEPQRRLTPHAHFAMRGTLPRATVRQVVAATYHQVWWPQVTELVYDGDRLPVWDPDGGGFVDRDTREALPTWDEALSVIDNDPDAEPAHVVRFGPQVDIKGVDAGSRDAARLPGYMTKYLTKNAAECHSISSDPQRAHLDRLWAALRVTPCSDRCPNWVLYGVQPRKAHGKLRPGRCKGRVHQHATLGIGGRRVLVSRQWSGKTLADHKADAHAWVRALLALSEGHEDAEPVHVTPQEPDVYAWAMARPDEPGVPPIGHRLLRAVSERIQWRHALLAAKDRAAQLSAAGGALDRDGQEVVPWMSN